MKIALSAIVAATILLSPAIGFAEAYPAKNLSGSIARTGGESIAHQSEPCKSFRKSDGASNCGKFVIGAQKIDKEAAKNKILGNELKDKAKSL